MTEGTNGRDAGPAAAGPGHVVILALGPTLEDYIDRVKRLGSRKRFADEVWGINAVGDIVQCDRVFHMDDVRVQEIRAAEFPDGNIAAMLGWLRTHKGPVYTSIPREGYPGLVAYPLQDVVNSTKHAYFNSTVAYAVALAIHEGAREISLFGVDFTYPNRHHAEKGRACVEFWLGIASERGIEIGLPERTSLLDMIEPDAEKFYGFDLAEVAIEGPIGGSTVTLKPRETEPTAAEIEARYDHRQHPNRLARPQT